MVIQIVVFDISLNMFVAYMSDTFQFRDHWMSVSTLSSDKTCTHAKRDKQVYELINEAIKSYAG